MTKFKIYNKDMEELVTLFTHLLNKIVDDFGKGTAIFQCI